MSSKTYLGNPNLKGMGVNVDWTPEVVEEYKKCMESPLYFIKNFKPFWKLKTPINFSISVI